jgi:hypothetical protein
MALVFAPRRPKVEVWTKKKLTPPISSYTAKAAFLLVLWRHG